MLYYYTPNPSAVVPSLPPVLPDRYPAAPCARRLLCPVGRVLACLLLIGYLSGVARAGELQVAVTIAPLHSLVSRVMQGVAEPALIVPATVSAHSPALRPSGARALQQADLIVRIGPTLERSLVRPLQSLARPTTPVIDVIDLPGLRRWPLRDAGHDARDHDDHDPDHEQQAAPEAIDPHVWLDPANAAIIARAVGETLGRIDAGNADRYQDNVRSLSASLERLEAAIAAILSGRRGQRLVVYHDAWQYFERAFGLGEPIAVTADPEQARSVSERRRLARELRGAGARCIFMEPQFDGQPVTSLARQFNLQIGVLDPLGASITPGPDHYEATMLALARAIGQCR